MTRRELSAKEIAQRQQSGRKHGAYSFRQRGEDALGPVQRSRLQELKDQFTSEPGRLEYRRDLAAFLAMIVELGGANIREIVENGGNIWDSSPISKMGTYLNGLIRLLDTWPKDKSPQDITELLSGRSRDADED